MITFTDLTDHIVIVFNGKPYNVPKNTCVIKKIDFARFSIHSESGFSIQGIHSEVSLPVTPDIDTLISVLSDMFNEPIGTGNNATEVTQLLLLTELQAINVDTDGLSLEATQQLVLSELQDIETNTAGLTGISQENTQLLVLTELQDIENNTTGLATEATLLNVGTEITQQAVLQGILALQLDFQNSNITGIDFIHNVAQGNVPGYKWISLHGKRNNLANGAPPQVIWEGTDTYTWLTSAQTLKVSSTSLLDDPSGPGAWAVEVDGLDSGFNEISEIVTLNGQNPINTVNQYIRINHIHIHEAGANGVNTGGIYIGNGAVVLGVNATPQGFITTGCGHPTTSVFTVPAGKRLQVVSIKMYCMSENLANNRPAQIQVWIRDAVTGLLHKELEYDVRDFINLNDVPLMPIIQEKTDIWAVSINLTSDNTVNAFLSYQGFLIDN